MHGASGSKARIQAPVSEVVAQTWTIPGNRMKADREHRVPLSPRCVEILRHTQRLTDGGSYVFPGRRSAAALVEYGVPDGATPDGSGRHYDAWVPLVFRDWGGGAHACPRTVCEAALAHTVRDKTEAAYRRTDLFEKRRGLMDAWAQYATTAPACIGDIGAAA